MKIFGSFQCDVNGVTKEQNFLFMNRDKNIFEDDKIVGNTLLKIAVVIQPKYKLQGITHSHFRQIDSHARIVFRTNKREFDLFLLLSL